MLTLIQAGLTLVTNLWESLKSKTQPVEIPEPVDQKKIDQAKKLLKPEEK